MKKGLLYTLGITVLITSAVVTSRAQIQVQQQQRVYTAPITAQQQSISPPSAPGPYYALPSWDQKLPSSTRFILLSDWGDTAVLDRETGLVWERSPNMTSNSSLAASHYCTTKDIGGRKGWRLPTIEQLASLVDASVNSPVKLPTGHPFIVLPKRYWSTTLKGTAPYEHWTVVFADGSVGPYGGGYPAQVWCVRGGQP